MTTLRAKGHRLTVTWSGERGEASSSTGECRCGWSESASSQREVRNEYRYHLQALRDAAASAAEFRRVMGDDAADQLAIEESWNALRRGVTT